ncbi:MAG: two-component system, chemotaxis family, response regulator WspR [Massilia sp.]
MSPALACQSPHTPCRVLLVGAPPFAAALREMLAGADDIELVLSDAAGAAQQAASLRPAVIVRALAGAEDCSDFIRACRGAAPLRDLPLLVLAPGCDGRHRDAAFAAGASDYLSALPAGAEILARLRYHAAVSRVLQERDEAQRSLRASQDVLLQVRAQLDLHAGIDTLTGIPSRRRFDDVAQAEWGRARRSGQTLSVLVCDLDNFSCFNERLGQEAGDLCLRKLAGVLTAQLKRPSDLAARYDGKRFAILLADTGLDGAVQVAEGCRAALERLALSHPLPERRIVTMSIGAATTVPADDISFEAVVARAEEAVGAAKARGRNRVAAFRV